MLNDPKRAGMLSVIAALLTPSWWVLPQVLAGLGLVSLLSAGCLFWLERLQPLFFIVAVGALVYQVWMVYRRPSSMRTLGMKTILAVSLGLNAMVLGGWVVFAIRYR
jgi:hypothetical protein